MKGGLLLTTVLSAGQSLLYAQSVESPHGITSPFSTYDDASLTNPGVITLAQYGAINRKEGGYSFSGPGIDFTLGLSRRFELSGFGALAYPPSDSGGYMVRADDSYFGLKALFWGERGPRPAVAIKPTLELLGPGGGSDRVHLVIPLIVQKSVGPLGLAYTGGYATRGVLFTSLKGELDTGIWITPVAVVTASRVTKNTNAIAAMGFNVLQLEGSAGLNIRFSPRWSLFAAAGRTLGPRDQNSSDFKFAASLAFTGRVWGRDPEGGPPHPPVRSK